MAVDGNGTSRLPKLSLETLVLLGSMVAAIGGQWMVMGSQISDLREDMKQLTGTVYSLTNRLYVLETRYEYLQRQSNLRPPVPSPSP